MIGGALITGASRLAGAGVGVKSSYSSADGPEVYPVCAADVAADVAAADLDTGVISTCLLLVVSVALSVALSPDVRLFWSMWFLTILMSVNMQSKSSIFDDVNLCILGGVLVEGDFGDLDFFDLNMAAAASIC